MHKTPKMIGLFLEGSRSRRYTSIVLCIIIFLAQVSSSLANDQSSKSTSLAEDVSSQFALEFSNDSDHADFEWNPVSNDGQFDPERDSQSPQSEVEDFVTPVDGVDGNLAVVGNPGPNVVMFQPVPVSGMSVTESVYMDFKPFDDGLCDTATVNSTMNTMSGYTLTPDILSAIGNLNIKEPQAPYSLKNQQDSVSILNGNLTVEVTDLTLPGRNGLSFTLKRYYDASNANLFEPDVYENLFCLCKVQFNATQYKEVIINGVITPYGNYQSGRFEYSAANVYDGSMSNYLDAVGWYNFVVSNAGKTIYSDWYVDRQTGYQTRTVTLLNQPLNVSFTTGPNIFNGWKSKADSKTYAEKLYPIGKGWTWNIPYIKWVRGKQYIDLIEAGTYEITYHMYEGYKLAGYPFKDLTIEYDNNRVYVNGEHSSLVLKSIKGIKHYFNNEGRLIRIADRYNNTIDFHYSQHPTYGKVLTKIIDAVGNSIDITYDSNEVILTQGDKTVRYSKSEYTTKDTRPPFGELKTEILDSVTDPLNRVTTYEYSYRDAPFSLVSTTPERTNWYALLTGINHPTGASTIFEFESYPMPRRVGQNAVQNVYRIAFRKDVASGVTYNLRNYTYTNPQGVNTDYAASYGQNIDHFYVNVSDGLTTTIYDHRKKVGNADEPPQFYTNQVTITAGDESRITTYAYDEARKIPYPIQTNVQLKKGSATSQVIRSSVTYDDYGNILTETNPLGVTKTYTYDPTSHLLSSIHEPIKSGESRYTTFARNAQGSITQMSIRKNDANGELLAKVDYDIDEYGNARRTIVYDDDRYIVYEHEYGARYQHAFPTKQTVTTRNYLGQAEVITTELEYYPRTGLVKSVKDGRNNVTSYQYDLADRLIRVTHPDGTYATVEYTDGPDQQAIVSDETGVKTRIRWDQLGNVKDESILDGSYRVLKSYGYDAHGRLQWESDNLGQTTTYEYDAWNRLKKKVYPDGFSDLVEYDDINRQITYTDPEGNKRRTTSDILDRVVLEEEWRDGQYRQTASMSYDHAGNVVSYTNATDTTTYTYDVLGRLVRVKDALNKEYIYSYSLAGKLKSIRYPDGNQILKEYDELGRLIRQTNESGLIDIYIYDASNNMTGHIDPKGQVFTYVYNNRNWLTDRISPDEVVSFTYDAAGRRKTMQDGTGTTSYQYKTSTGELINVTYPDNRSISYTYNSLGLRESMTDPFGHVTRYSYDNRNRLASVGTGSGLDASYQYYKNNLLKEVTLGNGIKSIFSYQGLWLKTLQHQKTDGSLLHLFSYDYDGNGNILTRSGTQAGADFHDSFAYDALGRILTSSLFNEVYTYDNRDNRMTLQTEQPLQLVLGDANYVYDSKNRLIRATVDGQEVTYRYNGDGLLYERTENGVTTRYYWTSVNRLDTWNRENYAT